MLLCKPTLIAFWHDLNRFERDLHIHVGRISKCLSAAIPVNRTVNELYEIKEEEIEEIDKAKFDNQQQHLLALFTSSIASTQCG